MTLLGDPNDLVQDAASKGIGIVYDSCSEADREKMVTSLLETITGGRKEVNKVRGRTLD
jgi:proteasome component ECM29